MVEQIAPAVGEKDLAVDQVSPEEYLEHYAHDRFEWVKGRLIPLSPATDTHDAITLYLAELFHTYLTLRPIGELRREPFVMRIEKTGSFREPDLQLILDGNPGELTATGMIGAADIAVEVVSQESSARDYGDKHAEYEQAGVREYWIIDPLRKECRFHHLNDEDVYETFLFKRDGEYHSPLLPDLVLPVAVFWQPVLPDIIAVVDSVQAMLE